MIKKFLYLFIPAALSLIFLSCGSSENASKLNVPEQPIKYSIVFVIHGDGDYLYHDLNGDALQADEVALEQAKNIGTGLRNSEVFIVHQKEERHFLFFPLDDGEYFYYRNGVLINQDSYSRNRDQSAFENESSLFQQNRSTVNNNISNTFFLFYGHQIPELDGRGYDASEPLGSFNIDSLVKGLKSIQKTLYIKKFSLVVLSSCNNGTPGIISKLSNIADYIIASPGNLHLSYLNPGYLKTLNDKPKINLNRFTNNFAEHAFNILKSKTETMISVAVYNIKKIAPLLSEIYPKYSKALASLQAKGDDNFWKGCDCVDDSVYDFKLPENGVNVFYQPPLFGKEKNKTYNSGWGCWDLY